AALKFAPVKITRKCTDLQYRRNEPEAYRRQARIGDAPKVRPWLASKDAELRARACELLMYVEDGAEPDVPALAKLLTDEAVDALKPWLKAHELEYHAAEAAVALGRIGTPEATAALWDAVRAEVPNKQVHIARYFQQGPRPEEYALLKGLILAGAKTDVK